MQIFLPTSEREDFQYFLQEKTEVTHYVAFYRTNNGVYSQLAWDDVTLTYDKVKEFWAEYDTRNRAIYSLEDGFVISAAEDEKFTHFFYGNLTGSGLSRKESDFTVDAAVCVSKLEVDFPLAVEFNPSNYYMIRNVPTIILLGREVWRNQGQYALVNSPQGVAFRNLANLVFMPNSMVTMESLYFIQENRANCIVLPFCVIRKNELGFGNTILLNSVMFSEDTMSGIKSIFELLKEDFFWKKLLIPLAFTDFETLKTELENQEIPLALQAKAFILQSKNGLLLDIKTLNEANAIISEEISELITEITDKKLTIDRGEQQIAEKQKEFESALSSTKLEDEFKKVETLPYVTKLTFTSEGMAVYTEPIQIDNGPFLGGYKIVYNPATRKLAIFNEVNPVTKDGLLAHPHVPQGGLPCFGNYSDIFFRFGTGEFYVAIEELYRFLGAYNPEDTWGRRMLYWDDEFYYKDMKERELLHLLGDAHDRRYHEITGEHLPCITICSECGEPARTCACNICEVCQRPEDECECWICTRCGGNIDNGDCYCDRCDQCHELDENCECDRCEDCEGLLDYNHYGLNGACECPRCPDNYDHRIDEDEDETCMECREWECQYNQNNEPHQEERLFE